MVVVELSFERHVRGFWEHALLFEDGQDSQWLQEKGGIKRSEFSVARCHPSTGDSLYKARQGLTQEVLSSFRQIVQDIYHGASSHCSSGVAQAAWSAAVCQPKWDWPGLQDMGLAQIHSTAGEALSCILAGVPLSKKRWVSSIKGFQNLIQSSLNQ